MTEALELLTSVRDRFRSAYALMLDEVLASRLPLAVCTIYEPRFSEITREALARGVDCIDLRIV